MLALTRHNNPVNQNPGDLDLLRRQRLSTHSFHLSNHGSSAIVNRLSDGQDFANHRLLRHRQIADRISQRRPNQADVNGKRMVEQPGLSVQFNSLHQVICRDGVESSASMNRVNKRTQSNMSNTAGPTGRDVSQQLADDALREIVCLHLFFNGQPSQPRHQVPVSANHTCDQSFVSQMVESPGLTVPLSGRIDQREPCRMTVPDEATLNGRRQPFRMSCANESAADNRLTVVNDSDCFIGRNRFNTSATLLPHDLLAPDVQICL